ncbi:MAG: porin [Acidovorax sp.]
MKSTYWLAAAGLAALSTGAFAQSSTAQDGAKQPVYTPNTTMQTAQPGLPAQALPATVPSKVTLSGVVDLFVGSYKIGSSPNIMKLSDGGNSASLLVLSGSEDLGGGLRANFLLDGGISADTGAGTGNSAGGFAFSRQSYLGLEAPWGSVTAGKMYTPMFGALYIADPFGMNQLNSPTMGLLPATGGQPGLASNATTNPGNNMYFQARSANSVRYTSPLTSPLVVDLSYAFGEVAGHNSQGSVVSGALGYKQPGKFYAAYAFQIQKSGGLGYGGAPTPAGSPTAVASPLTSTFQALVGSYNIMPTLKVGGSFIIDKVNDSVSPKAKFYQLGATWDLPAASSSVLASFARRTVDNSSGFNQNAFTLGYNYYLSKRTSLYGRFVRYSNAGSNFGYAGYGGAVNPLGQPAASPSDNGAARALMLGIRHAF